jgi:formate--tetrahydrofolate ligase
MFCLSEDLADLKKRIARTIVAYNHKGNPVTVNDLNCVGAVAAVLKDAIKPNMVQTLENSPVLIHGGPFANIAHGCNSGRATSLGLKLADYCITEAGFGADLGAEKFFDIKCRTAGLKPDAVVLVATIRALKYNGGVDKKNLSEENMEALKKGIVNLEKHIENIAMYNVPCVVTINRFVTDTDAELNFVKKFCEERGCEFALSEVWEKGGEGGMELASKVLDTLENKESNFKPIYDDNISIKEKIETIAVKIYGASSVSYTKEASNEIKHLEDIGFSSLPVCMAKTQYSLSDDPLLLGRPENFEMNIRDVYISAGAGFIVVLTGNIMTMPGLPVHPAAEGIDVNEEGLITGLF